MADADFDNVSKVIYNSIQYMKNEKFSSKLLYFCYVHITRQTENLSHFFQLLLISYPPENIIFREFPKSMRKKRA